MKNHFFISTLILTTLALLATGCQKEHGFDYAELVDGETFNKFIPATARSVVFEYNEFTTGKRITLSTPTSPVPIYGHLDSTVWHVTTTASTIYANPHCAKMFYNRSKLKSIEFGSGFNTSNVTDMCRMFEGCKNLTSLNLSSFNPSNVTDMHGMFQGCNKLTNLNLSNFNTSNVQRMDAMFYGCSGLTSLDVSNFNTSNVVLMTRTVDTVLEYYDSYLGPIPKKNELIRFGMFAQCSSLTSLDLSSFNTSKVTDMRGLFEGCKNLTSLNVSSFNTSNVKYMDAMFKGCSSLTSLDLSNFNTSNVVSMGTVHRFFYNSGSAGQYGDYRYQTNGGMFENCTSLSSLDLSNFYTPNVARTYNMFYNCTHLTYLNLSNFDMSHLEDIDYDYHFAGKDYMCLKLSTASGNCTIVCTESVQNSLLELDPIFHDHHITYIPVNTVNFTWVRP